MEIDSDNLAVGLKRKAEGTGDDDLTHLFDDDLKESDLYPQPTFNPWATNKPAQLVNVASELDANDPEWLRLFYRHFFPYNSYYKWLNYDSTPKPSRTFMHREFCFTLQDDTYIRFQSFLNQEEFKREVLRLCPAKIDLGAIYNIRPKDKKNVRPAAFVPVSKELVFDIDMTDYDEIRTCCSGGDVCSKCWEFMTVAMKIIDKVLRDDFGFRHILWVYSGRRGIHCWVGDERARKLNNEQRRGIVKYVEVIRGGAYQQRKVRLPANLHPSLKRAFRVVRQHFPSLVFNSQGVFKSPEQWEKVLAVIPDRGIQAKLKALWAKVPQRPPREKWEDMRKAIEIAMSENRKKTYLKPVLRDIMFQYTYPRLDDKVSTHINHLLKSPFCVHPKTGRVCVPIDINKCDEFDPSTPPTVQQLCHELNSYDARVKAAAAAGDNGAGSQTTTGNNPNQKIPDWQKTSLGPYVKVFERFVGGIVREARDKRRMEAQTQASLEF
ncbi:hypothetical protein DFQ27_004438 [Actinomortierella ambigua]|uniref:DNA primase n=1 Tax=Actinomortierella ambigua TaxID=1343610 RepID=A0A9P6Q1V7_9FUNG|nr:hypothetical protein DFQ27_004438 [Actinomortierella ambigua]